MAIDEIAPASGNPTETSPLLGDTAKPSWDASEEDDAVERQDEPTAPDGMPDMRKRLPYVVAAVGVGIFLGAADQTIIVSSYGRIGSDLNALNQTSWIATAYFLTLTSFQPLYGKLSDIFGRKACLLFAYTIFGVGSVLCGLAPDMKSLIAARAFAGIGGGGMTTVVQILLSDILTLRERGTWQGYINIIYSSGAAAGAPLGGLFADTIGWRWSFIVQGPMCAIAFAACFSLLQLPKRDDSHWKEKLGRIDFLGAATLFSAVCLLLFALDRGSNVSWQATVTIVTLSVSLPFFLAFVFVETKIAKEPFAPGHVIFKRAMLANYVCLFFSMASFIAALYYVPLYFQAVDGLTATGSSVRLLPVIVCTVFGSLFGGYYMKWTGRFYWLTVLGYQMLVCGMVVILLCSGVIIQNIIGVVAGLMVGAFTSGLGSTSTVTALLANASQEDQAVAVACSYLFRSLGSVFGISLSATVSNQVLRKALAAHLPTLGLPEHEAAEIADRVRESLAYLRKLDPKLRHVVVACYTQSLNATFGLQLGFAVLAAVAVWFIKEKPLNK